MSIINTPGQISRTVQQPSNYELAQPFHVDATGGLAVVTDPIQVALQHLLMIAFTMPGERVMRPSYGAGLQSLVFSNAPLAVFNRAAQVLQQAYMQTDGGGITNVSVAVKQLDTGTYAFSVSFTVDQDPIVHQAVFDYAGNLIGSN